MEYKIANTEEIKNIYEEYMKKDFPPAELKPLKAILYAVEQGYYKVYAAYDDDGIKGYANMAHCGDGICFLDYFAVTPKCRQKGYGSVFFNELAKLCGCELFVLEVESVESAINEEQAIIRRRRIDFYKRNGCMDTGCVYKVFGVEYNVLVNRKINMSEELLSKILSAYEYAYAAILRRGDVEYIQRVR